jgi:hypothetical protein
MAAANCAAADNATNQRRATPGRPQNRETTAVKSGSRMGAMGQFMRCSVAC